MSLFATYTPIPPYDFARTAACSRYYTVLGKWDGAAYWRALRVGDALALVSVTGHGTVDAPVLEARLVATTGEVDEDTLRERLAALLNVRAGLRSFYAAAQADPVLARLAESLYGVHLLQTETVFEALCVTIIEQQIALAAAQRGERWLVGWAGDCIEYKGEHFYTFPRRERLAAATVDDLTPLKITFIRMARLIDLALTFDPEPLRALPHEAAYRALVALKGVGHWTAAWTLMRGANQPVYVGSADVALRAAVNHYWHGAKGRADTAATDALFARFGAFGGLAAFTTLMRWALDRYPRDG